MNVESGFVKGSSDNLPKIDLEMVNDFYVSNIQFLSAEVRNRKSERAGRESYGDNAVEYVQVKRTGCICTVKARITPEHKIHRKGYEVVAEIHERDDIVSRSSCMSCAASCGGWKHGVAFLLWLHRRSEEPSVTEKKCYWKKSRLSRVTASAGENINSLLGKTIPKLGARCPTFLQEIISAYPDANGSLFNLFKKPELSDTSMYRILLSSKKNSEVPKTADSFLSFAKSIMTQTCCEKAEKKTKNQYKSSKWFQLRFGIITASNVYEAARCKTFSGALTEKILGASQPLEDAAVKRGIIIESAVLEIVEKKENIKIANSGLILSPKYPIFGASPDGITDDLVIEVKCPFKEKSVERYISNDGSIQKKYFYQIQLQMSLAKKKKGYFCVASPHFENDKEVVITEVEFDERILEIIAAIFTVLIKSGTYMLIHCN